MRHQPNRERAVEQARIVVDMAQRAVNNGGEPNYSGEKLIKALRANVQALEALDIECGDIGREIRKVFG